MSLLKLTPESERLRRLAKAHAAGEIATPEYRQMRADVILSFTETAGQDTSDVTERRAAAPRAPAAPEAEKPAPTPAPEPRAWWRYGLALGAILLLWVVASVALR